MRSLSKVMSALLLSAGLSIMTSSAYGQIYSKDDLQKDAARLRNAVMKIYEIGLKPSLTPEERRGIGDFEFRFPMPKPDDIPLNFYATTDGRFLIMPLLSLKALEDLSIAYAWLYHQKMSLSTIDLYFTMLRYREPKDFPGGKHPPILQALGVPDNALKDPKVDELSLSLRNEAFAFIIMHELGHILFRHKPISDITAVQARDDETQSDKYALDVLARTGTPPLGAALFFQAQIYSLEHRAEFKSDEDFRKYMTLTMTHPLSVERIKAMAAYIAGPLARSRPKEAAIWRGIALQLGQVVEIMEDVELARCVVKVAKEANLSILEPRKNVEAAQMLKYCRT